MKELTSTPGDKPTTLLNMPPPSPNKPVGLDDLSAIPSNRCASTDAILDPVGKLENLVAGSHRLVLTMLTARGSQEVHSVLSRCPRYSSPLSHRP